VLQGRVVTARRCRSNSPPQIPSHDQLIFLSAFPLGTLDIPYICRGTFEIKAYRGSLLLFGAALDLITIGSVSSGATSAPAQVHSLLT
jgi:hypothetical protein